MLIPLKTLKNSIWYLLGLCLYTNAVFAYFSINYAETHLVNNMYMLNAELEYQLTEIATDALQNGITLTLGLKIVIERERTYLWDERIKKITQYYQLKYYALRKQYVIEYLNTGIKETFTSLNIALEHIGKITNFPLLEASKIEADEIYQIYLQTYLDIEFLPIPLRPIAHLSSQWRLRSDWYSCQLK
ncbi:MAG: DUF4390 domain-containing protein [Thiomargarita sp.]|nr:DUF4390 domain-containing protein [Thiomargarita sp.]